MGDLQPITRHSRIEWARLVRVPLVFPQPDRGKPGGRFCGVAAAGGHRNHVWAWDFLSNHTERGGRLRAFNLIDKCTLVFHCIHADRAIKAADVFAVSQTAISEHGAPEYIRSDNGPEFIVQVIQQWRRTYNTIQKYGPLNKQTPEQFATHARLRSATPPCVGHELNHNEKQLVGLPL